MKKLHLLLLLNFFTISCSTPQQVIQPTSTPGLVSGTNKPEAPVPSSLPVKIDDNGFPLPGPPDLKVEEVLVNPQSITAYARGYEQKITALVKYNENITSDQVNWSSSDKCSGFVDDYGNFKPIKRGQIKITATAKDDPMKKAVIPVDISEEYISPNVYEKPINHKIVFVSEKDGKKEIYSMKDNGSNPVRLTYNDYNEKLPRWSPNGTKIVFNAEMKTETYSQEFINVMGSDGMSLVSNKKDIGEFYSSPHFPNWLPDNSKIIYTETEFDQISAFSINPDLKTGKSRLNIGVGSLSFAYYPSFTQDSEKAAFILEGTGLYVYDIQDKSRRLIYSGTEISAPSWSLDTENITFTDTKNGKSQIFMINDFGCDLINLSNNNFNDKNASFAPNGKKIVFQSDRDGNEEIYTMDPNGTNLQRLTNNNYYDGEPDYN
jgi:tricorn protease-like protein